MKVFHICKKTREDAIRRYGTVERCSLPFDPRTDTVSIQAEQVYRPRFGLFREPFIKFRDLGRLEEHWTHRDKVDDAEITRRRELWQNNEWARACGLWYCDADEVSASITKHPKFLGNLFMSRIQKVEIIAHGSILFMEDWEAVLGLLNGLKEIRQLKINLWQHDTCGMEDLDPATDCYKAHDAWIIMATANTVRASHWQMMPKLEVFEMVKTAYACAGRLDRRRNLGLLGEWFFAVAAGDEPEDIDAI
ncbi:hypothetical protein F5B20DRAFT_531495 [Whalleya microplaca]|nr:hypothetical protein F5B20DRAFT_531495 [Whalleya microplaca]